MQIVINIHEKDYQSMKNGHIPYSVLSAIMKGTPLPKGHGRLIDADELKTLSYEVFVDTDNPNRLDGLSVCNGLVEDDIDLAPTIIDADKELEQPDKCKFFKDADCCYPIEDCNNCTNHKESD